SGRRAPAGGGRTWKPRPGVKAKVTARRATLLRDLETRLELCPDLREALEAALVEEPPLSAKEGGVIRRGYHGELDELHDVAKGGKEWIIRYQAVEMRRTEINSLKVGFNIIQGYYI